ncbi:MAG: ribonuclease T, partial [Shewanella sp.]
MTQAPPALSRTRLSLTLILGLLSGIFSASALAAPATGVFIADKHCELFQSKNKRTNPDDARSEIGQHYPVVEILGDSLRPEWLRVQSQTAKAPLRWISGECGQYQDTAAKGVKPSGALVQTRNVQPSSEQPSPVQTSTEQASTEQTSPAQDANQCQRDGQ